MEKQYIQYDKVTGQIMAVTSGKRKKDARGKRFTEKPDFKKLPAGVGGMELDADIDVYKKKLNLTTMVVEDVVKTDFEIFQDEWSHARIIEHLLDRDKLKFLVKEAEKHKDVLLEVN